jgi:hypothetical protein
MSMSSQRTSSIASSSSSLPFPSPALPSPHPTTTILRMSSARLRRRSEPPPILAARLSMAAGEENWRQPPSARATLVVGGSISRHNKRTCRSILRRQGSTRQLELMVKGLRGRRRTSMMLVHCSPSDEGWFQHSTPSCLPPPTANICPNCHSPSSLFGKLNASGQRGICHVFWSPADDALALRVSFACVGWSGSSKSFYTTPRQKQTRQGLHPRQHRLGAGIAATTGAALMRL